MPTGYTAGIIDGTTKTFPEFAKLCARAFGAMIHMRDDSFKEEYKPRTPTDYHTKEMSVAKGKLDLATAMTDEEIIVSETSKLLEEKEYSLKAIERVKATYEKLNKILVEAEAWEPPTSEHTGIKEFMIQQITDTMKWDGSTRYHDEKLDEIEHRLKNLDAATIREERIADAKHDIEYHEKEHNAEIARCATANKWVEDYFNSLQPQTV